MRPPLGGEPPRPRGRALGLLVLALHLSLGLALHQLLRPAAHGTAAAAAPVHVWISLALPERPARPPKPVPEASMQRQPAPRSTEPPQPLARPARPTEPQAISLPAETSATATPAASTTAEASAPRATDSAPPAALNLALPGRAASAPAPNAWTRQDPRVHDAPQDGDQRMARTLGTDTTLRRVARGDGFELRRGNDCVQVQPSRAGQIFMPDGGSRPPSQVGKC